MILGALSPGRSVIRRPLLSGDCLSTLGCLQALGVPVRVAAGKIVIPESRTKKTDGRLRPWRRPSRNLDCGNSGTTMRLLSGVLAGRPFRSVLSGDASLSRRPMKRVIEPLSKMGAGVRSRPGGLAPLKISGRFPLRPIRWRSRVASAQVKSAVLLAGLQARGETRFTEPALSRDHTERMLKTFGANIGIKGTSVFLKGDIELTPKDLDVPGDISSASFFLVGALLLKGSSIKIRNISINPTRAGILKILSKMGGRIKIINKKNLFEPAGDIVAEYSRTRGITIDKDMIPGIIDELPIIFVLASLSKGRTIVKGAEELRVKEADRINSMQEGLKAMGAKFYLKGDEVIIEGVEKLAGARLKSFGDHRTCMAMAIAAITASGESRIEGAESVSKSFPGFFGVLANLSMA